MDTGRGQGQDDGASRADETQFASATTLRQFYSDLAASMLAGDAITAERAFHALAVSALSIPSLPIIPPLKLTSADRQLAGRLVRAHAAIARQLSELIGAPAVVIVPSDDCFAAGREHPLAMHEARTIGQAIQAAMQRTVAACFRNAAEPLLDEIRGMIASVPTRYRGGAGRLFDTAEIARRLGLHPKTVRRLCHAGRIDADKLASGEWRTTEARLRASPYVRR